jgi:Protein of unknown function DUF262
VPQKGRITFDMAGIASVLSSGEYKVPIYQRSYAWSDGQVEDFWRDLRNALEGDEPDYFLGTLVLTLPSEEETRHTIIDGQQRLATTSLMLAAIRDEWESRGEEKQAKACDGYLSTFDRHEGEDVPRLMLNEEDDDFFRQLVIERSSPTPRRDSHERLKGAYELLATSITKDVADHGERAESRLKKWQDFMDVRALVTTVKVPTEADAFVIFETLNARGARLTVGDLLKNYLFMKAGNRLDAVKELFESESSTTASRSTSPRQHRASPTQSSSQTLLAYSPLFSLRAMSTGRPMATQRPLATRSRPSTPWGSSRFSHSC